MKLAVAFRLSILAFAPRPAVPLITGYCAATSPLPTGGTTALPVSASDPSATFAWSATGGSIGAESAGAIPFLLGAAILLLALIRRCS